MWKAKPVYFFPAEFLTFMFTTKLLDMYWSMDFTSSALLVFLYLAVLVQALGMATYTESLPNPQGWGKGNLLSLQPEVPGRHPLNKVHQRHLLVAKPQTQTASLR